MIKNRYTGTVGEVGLAFNPKSRRYFELTSHEREVFVQSGGDIKKLIESRMNKYGTIEPGFTEKKEEAKKVAISISKVRKAKENDISNAELKIDAEIKLSKKSEHLNAISTSDSDLSDDVFDEPEVQEF